MFTLLFTNAHAQHDIQWQQLTPKQQKILSPIKKDWKELPISRRAKLSQLTNKWDALATGRKNKIQ